MIGDKLRVRQILFNLIGNAIKFTDRGEVRVHATWCPSDKLIHHYPHLFLEVLDTGIGIPKNRMEEIFEDFRKADDSTTRHYGGTGWGTTIARNLMHLMGGHIGVDSQVGKGSRFWVRLPLRQEPRPLVSDVRQGRLDGRLVGPQQQDFHQLDLDAPCARISHRCQHLRNRQTVKQKAKT